ncbi:MAG: NAD+ synthase [Saprospiraceae bacterium]|nr:NAD+ synthase [Saprospiraceae bacterium]
MRIAIAQLNYHIGNFEGNLRKMLEAVEEAKAQHVDLICFGELATCGYPPRDFLEFADFVRRSHNSVLALCEVAHDIAIIVGSPAVNPVVEGKDLHNSAFMLANGKIVHQSKKALLPTYDIFDENRYFEPATKFETFDYKGCRIAITICEDMWNIGNENPLYTICPMDEMMPQKPDLMINISASPFSYTHSQKRIDVIRQNALRYGLPLFYINHVGAQTEIIFDGGSLAISPSGHVIELPYFEEKLQVFELDDIVSNKENHFQTKDKYELIYRALILGISDYFGKLGFKKAILGLSGGIDSALTAVLASHALGPENVRVVLMPSKFSSSHSIEDAVALAQNLDLQYDIISIENTYQAFIQSLNPLFDKLPFDVTEENLQARCRGVILMAMSNKFGHILLNTSNKSEAAVGYGTLYGDMAGGLSVIGDLYKTEVFALCRHINRKQEIIPNNTLIKPPSAELRPNQKDSDSLPEYDILDMILYQYIEMEQGPREIVAMGYDAELVGRILRLVNINEFKRFQTPPVIRISSKAFGMGRRMPIVGKYLN